MGVYGEEQKKEIETIKPRILKIKLSDEDVIRISEKAGAAGLTVAGLLENFIGDLVCGTYSNGSDERMYAQNWFERCWFGSMPDFTFLHYLITWADVESFTDLLAEIEDVKAELAEIETDPEYYEPEDKVTMEENLSYCQSQIDEYWNEYTSRITKNYEYQHGSFEQEVEKVLEWKRQKDLLMGETDENPKTGV